MQDYNDFLMGGDKVPGASFLTVGTSHEGEITELKLVQELDDDGTPKTWDNNGEPKMQLRVTFQSEERDDEIEDDDGRRRFYLKFKQLQAVREAVKAALTEAGLDPKMGLEVGGWLGMEFVKQDKGASRMKSGVKHFEAWYEPPTPEQRAAAQNAAVNEAVMGDDDDDEPEQPKRGRGRAPAKTAAKATKAPARGRGKAADKFTDDDPDDADSDDVDDSDADADEEPAKPARGRGRGAAAKPAAKTAARGRGRRSTASDDDAF